MRRACRLYRCLSPCSKVAQEGLALLSDDAKCHQQVANAIHIAHTNTRIRGHTHTAAQITSRNKARRVVGGLNLGFEQRAEPGHLFRKLKCYIYT